ncbi:hypothetical protein AB0M28_39185 [Streptomyces sp. NPDC051940]|uniref:hypothetical protein n=1 Tax=Streptomyces sp. NPDC051940 TaxID=3155675 RepID=UPI00343ACA9F
MKAKTTAAALTAALALLLPVSSAHADGGGKSGPPTGDGAATLCKRVPKIEKRLERALKRLNGDETRRGSIARLEKRIENAGKLGHEEVATFLTDRLEFRKKLPAEIEKRQTDLKEVRTWCEDNGLKVGRR